MPFQFKLNRKTHDLYKNKRKRKHQPYRPPQREQLPITELILSQNYKEHTTRAPNKPIIQVTSRRIQNNSIDQNVNR
jgi:hypothetical protein